LAALLLQPAWRKAPLEVSGMEVFFASSEPSGLLVYHADEATRELFTKWLHEKISLR